MKKVLCKAVIYICFVLSMIFMLSSSYLFMDKITTANNISQILNDGYLHLTDTYDADEKGLAYFTDKKESLQILYEVNELLVDNSKLDYYVIDNQNLDLIGDFEKKFGSTYDFIAGNKKECMNQDSYKGVTTTAVKSIQMSCETMNKVGLPYAETIRKKLDKNSLVGNSKIPVIIGNNYCNYLKEGDSFEVYFLGMTKVTCEVVGILSQDYSFKHSINSMILNAIDERNLDDYIIFPYLDCKYFGENDVFFDKILMLQQCEGFVKVSSRNDFKKVLSIISEIKSKTGFSYDINPKYISALNKEQVENYQAILGIAFSMVLFVFSLCMLYKDYLKQLEGSQSENNTYLMVLVDFILNIAIHILFSFGVAFFFVSKFILKNEQGLYIVSLITMIIMSVVCIVFVTLQSIFLRRYFNYLVGSKGA